MSYWLNNKTVFHPDLEKPCVKLRYCPYGQLIEEFPFDETGKLSCSLQNTDGLMQFGHNCPVHYHAELCFPVRYHAEPCFIDRDKKPIWTDKEE